MGLKRTLFQRVFSDNSKQNCRLTCYQQFHVAEQAAGVGNPVADANAKQERKRVPLTPSKVSLRQTVLRPGLVLTLE